MATSTAKPGGPDRAEVRDRLDHVRDPELDRSIVDLQYIDDISIEGAHVEVRLRLPTAWCSPAFAWLMATDARDAVRALPSVDAVTVALIDHMHSREINHGVNAGLSFEEAFEDAEDDVSVVREKLDHKARMRRQYDAMTALLGAGLTRDQVATLRLTDITIDDEDGRAFIQLPTLVIALDAAPLVEFVEKARATGVVSGPDDRLFTTPEGAPFPPSEFDAVRREARLAKRNMDGQAAICGGLHGARYDDVDNPTTE